MEQAETRGEMPADMADHPPERSFKPIETVVNTILKVALFYGELYRVLRDTVLAMADLKGNQLKYIRTTIMHQIIFTGIDAFTVVSAIGMLVGGVVMVQIIAFSRGFESDTIVMPMMMSIIIRELAPLLTALIIIARTGSAVTIELGHMKLKGHHHALKTMGIDLTQFFHLPRVIGITFSAVVLNIYFVIITLGAALFISLFRQGVDMWDLLFNFVTALKAADLLVCIVKGLVLGLLISLTCLHHGMLVQDSPTQIPQQASSALVNSYMLCYKFTVAISVVFYLVQ